MALSENDFSGSIPSEIGLLRALGKSVGGAKGAIVNEFSLKTPPFHSRQRLFPSRALLPR